MRLALWLLILTAPFVQPSQAAHLEEQHFMPAPPWEPLDCAERTLLLGESPASLRRQGGNQSASDRDRQERGSIATHLIHRSDPRGTIPFKFITSALLQKYWQALSPSVEIVSLRLKILNTQPHLSTLPALFDPGYELAPPRLALNPFARTDNVEINFARALYKLWVLRQFQVARFQPDSALRILWDSYAGHGTWRFAAGIQESGDVYWEKARDLAVLPSDRRLQEVAAEALSLLATLHFYQAHHQEAPELRSAYWDNALRFTQSENWTLQLWWIEALAARFRITPAESYQLLSALDRSGLAAAWEFPPLPLNSRPSMAHVPSIRLQIPSGMELALQFVRVGQSWWVKRIVPVSTEGRAAQSNIGPEHFLNPLENLNGKLTWSTVSSPQGKPVRLGRVHLGGRYSHLPPLWVVEVSTSASSFPQTGWRASWGTVFDFDLPQQSVQLDERLLE